MTAIEESQVEAEQETLAIDEHDDDVMNISLRLQALSAPNTDTVEATPIPNRILIGRRLAQLQARLLSVTEEANTLSGDPAELHLAHTYQEIIADLKAELADVRKEAVVIAADSSDELSTAVRNQDKDIFNLSVKIKKLLYNPGYAMESLTHGVKLLTLLRSMATCSIGKLSESSLTFLSTVARTLLMRKSWLISGQAKSVIEGLSQSGDQYAEALKARYDRPRLIHQAHARKIYEAPNLKDGSGTPSVQQHLRAMAFWSIHNWKGPSNDV